MDLHVGRRLRLAEIVDLLTEARARTLLLVSTVSDEDLLVQHDPLMSPIIWDLGHIGHFEDVWLVESVDGGSDGSDARFLISQLFLDNEKFFDFLDRARGIGIEVPIVPGIMPIATVSGIRRMASMNGTCFPPELEAELDQVDGDDAATYALGVRWAHSQCEELLERGVPGIHFYTLNRSPATREIYRSLFG